MKKNDLIDKIKNIAEECSNEMGYEIVDVEYQVGNKHDLLSIFIYKKEGIDINDCTNMSRIIESVLDKEDIIDKPYYLEISSPGLDRPLKTKDDYRRNIGNEVTVKLYAPLDGKKLIEGILENYDESIIILSVEDEKIEIPIKSISLMRQSIKF
ncbi:ribosome maturation factor RimP [Peptoniphilus mikwangii]|uniref:ribosome maturation factor RimP n=1 Tax=Peptoniphilus mikwangii TaxID=1354300 RepID=UPI00040B0C62|nr:ribosome maturation factor RimP [Peptoniphilus mikwangii]